MNAIKQGHWQHNGCEIYESKHEVHGNWEIYKDSQFIERAYSLKAAQIIIDEKFGKRRVHKRKGAGRKPATYKTVTVSARVRVGWVDAVKAAMNREIERLKSLE